VANRSGRLSVRRWVTDDAWDRLLPLAVYLAVLALALGATAALLLAISGAPAVDGLVGELEGPLAVAGAALALVQLAQLEGIPIALACAGWRLLPRHGAPLWLGVAAAGLPIFTIHHGTFVAVARPAEPFIAALAAVALLRASDALVGWPWGRRHPVRPALGAGVILSLLTALAAAQPAAQSARALLPPATVDPGPVLARITRAAPPGTEVLAPPYYAVLAGRRMLFDYPDWTVWGLRAQGGRPREAVLAQQAAALLEQRALPLVAADFRLSYLADVRRALERSYVAAGTDGDVPARSVTFFVPG
jgi:hypothetical protein